MGSVWTRSKEAWILDCTMPSLAHVTIGCRLFGLTRAGWGGLGDSVADNWGGTWDNTVTEAEEAKLEDCAGPKCWETIVSDLEALTEGEEWGPSIEDEEEGLELRGGWQTDSMTVKVVEMNSVGVELEVGEEKRVG